MANRRQSPRRQPNRTVLIATNGARTEMAYLAELKRRARGSGVRIKVEFVHGDPETVLHKLARPLGDTSEFDEVWIVVDEDGTDRRAFVTACKKRCSKRQSWHAIVSRPCFEVWLVAHYEQVGNMITQDDAQRHFRKLIPAGTPAKSIPSDFPYDAMLDAAGRCQLPGTEPGDLHDLPPLPGTAMPHLLRALGLR